MQFFIHFSKIVKVHYFVREVVMSKYVTQTAVPGARNSSSVALLLLLGVYSVTQNQNCKQFDQTGKLTTFCVIISKITHIGPQLL